MSENQTLVRTIRPRKVVQWVDHFYSCNVCRKPHTSFPVEAKPRSELCSQGQKYLDVWLAED